MPHTLRDLHETAEWRLDHEQLSSTSEEDLKRCRGEEGGNKLLKKDTQEHEPKVADVECEWQDDHEPEDDDVQTVQRQIRKLQMDR